MLELIARLAIKLATKNPYFHLKHADGSYYMERYWLIGPNFTGYTVRLHIGHTPDLDRAMHDHPWGFVSVVLRGWYHEQRPLVADPCFDGDSPQEIATVTVREAGSIAKRRATDRHRISVVAPDGYVSLFIAGPKRHWWGFFTPKGKVHWQDYESAHNNTAITGEKAA